MNIAKPFFLILTLICTTSLAATVRAADLQVRQPNGAEIGMPASCAVLSTKFEVKKETEVVDYGGRSYYFCCPQCVEDFKKDPGKYASSGELPLRLPRKDEIGRTETCPVSGLEFQVADETQIIDYKGRSYYFCCTPCVIDFRKNPGEYSK